MKGCQKASKVEQVVGQDKIEQNRIDIKVKVPGTRLKKGNLSETKMMDWNYEHTYKFRTETCSWKRD